MSKMLWKPTLEIINKANITLFIRFVNKKRGTDIKDYSDLYQWSVTKIEDFWEDVWLFTGIIGKYPGKIVENLEKFPPQTKWFPGSRLNFAENLLRYRDENLAMITYREDGISRRITYKQLSKSVARLSNALKDAGVRKGDRVVGYMPNIPETIIAMLASTAIGATWASCGVELGGNAAIDRLGQVEPVLLFSVDAYLYKGKKFDQLDKVRSLINAVPSIKNVVILPYVDEKADIASIKNGISYHDFLSDDTAIEFTPFNFDHPLYIMFSSGTTGKPKCLVQGAGGVLINHLKELVLHTDMRREDTLFYISSPSWMMWNWMTTSLAVGSTLALYDGNPLYPDWKKAWEFINKNRITIFGCSASYLHYLKGIEVSPGKVFALNSLRQISQTGSSLSEEGFEYVYSEIKSNIHFNSISGGTDINGCFAAGSPTLPVYSGQLQARALGMKVVAYDVENNHIEDEQGELVCELPAPSMPIYFWNDPEHSKYNNAYFDYYDKKVWRHGDYIEIDSVTGGMTFYGRSDSVLKPSGVRIGTAEIYNVVEELAEVADSLAIGQQWKGDQRVLLFIKLAENFKMTEELEDKIRRELRSKASPRHVPAEIIVTPDIPYTFSGKKVESAITNIIHGREIMNRGAMSNPECLNFYENMSF